MRSRFTLALVLVMALTGLALPADAETTPGLDDVRRKANDATSRVQKLEAELGELDGTSGSKQSAVRPRPSSTACGPKCNTLPSIATPTPATTI